MPPKVNSKWCAAIKCTNNKVQNPDLSFFSFPAQDERCRTWIQYCRREDLIGKAAASLHKSTVLCEQHFEASQFTRPDLKGCDIPTVKRKRLIKTALPTIFHELSNPPPSITPTRPPPKKRKLTPKPDTGSPQSMVVPVQDEPSPAPTRRELVLSRANSNIRCKESRLRKQVTNLKQDIAENSVKSRKDLIRVSSRFLSNEQHSFFTAQLQQRAHWTDAQKQLALNIYYKSPATYRFLCKTFRLPSISTLNRSLASLHTGVGFNFKVMSALKMKVDEMSQNGRLCVLSFDEMSIKQWLTYNSAKDEVEGLEDYGYHKTNYCATQALVFMVRGLTEPWKQAFACFFSASTTSSSTLNELLTAVVVKTKEVGLVVKAVVCDQGANNRSVMQSMGVSVDQPYVTIDHSRIFTFFDPPHLLKNTRNNLMKQDFAINHANVSWRYVEQFYEIEKRLPVRSAPKLTDKHLNLPPFLNMRVSLAAQVLSHSVSAGMMTYCCVEKMPPEATSTAALFIDRMDKLFDTFNSRRRYGANAYARAISDDSVHLQFLRDTLEWLESLKPTAGRPLPFIHGWKVSIAALIQLWGNLSVDHGVKFLITSRLNQDCLENFFSIIRQRGGHRTNPDVPQFLAAFKQAITHSILQPTTGTNCQPDTGAFLLSLKQIAEQPDTDTQMPDVETSATDSSEPVPELPVIDETNTSLEGILTYIAGYLLRKTDPCIDCKSMLEDDDLQYQCQGTYTLMFFKAYDITKKQFGGLKVPSMTLVNLLMEWESVFGATFKGMVNKQGIRRRITPSITNSPRTTAFISQCPPACVSHITTMIDLFLRVRLHFAIKCLNQQQKKVQQHKRNRKILKLTHT